jgi:PTS system galactitol-specific IIA component
MSETTTAGPVDERLFAVDVEAADREALLRSMSAQLLDAGLVKDTFADALLAREAVYPTGLPTAVMRVAIPHTDVEHVVAPAIAVARLAAPLEFGEMGKSDGAVDVELVIVLAVADKTAQLGLLQALIGMFSDTELMTSLRDAPTAHDLFTVINDRVAPALAPAPDPDGES